MDWVLKSGNQMVVSLEFVTPILVEMFQFFHYYVSNVLVQPPTRERIQPSQWIHGRIVSGCWVLHSPISNRNKLIIDIIAHVGFLSLFRFGPTKTSWTHLRWTHHKSWGTCFQLFTSYGGRMMMFQDFLFSPFLFFSQQTWARDLFWEWNHLIDLWT